MRILIVCSGNAPNFDLKKHQAFIYEQVEAVKKTDHRIEFDYFFINQKGVKGYLNCLKSLKAKLRQHHYDCIHAHFVTSALLANLQRKIPVIATFHGSDINLKTHRWLSLVVELMSHRTIYVSDHLRKKALFYFPATSSVIPCGVDFTLFSLRSKKMARKKLGLPLTKKYILFSSHFENKVKNYPLAKAAVGSLRECNVKLLELKNFTREEVALLMTAVDVALMTSFSEGSPQFVKEALACNCPVVSTNVGDVKEVMDGIVGCYIVSYQPADIAAKIQSVLLQTKTINGREMITRFDNRLIAQKLMAIYKSV